MSKLHSPTVTYTHKRKVFRTLLIAAAIVMALSISALAFAGVFKWFNPYRDESTARRARTAQRTVEAFSRAVFSAPAEDKQNTAKAVENETRLSEILNENGQIDITLADYASEDASGNISYFFTPNGDPQKEGSIRVVSAPDGELRLMDMRQAFPYQQPDNVPEQYLHEGYRHNQEDNSFTPSGETIFDADNYLREVRYPDAGDYRKSVEPAAADAIRLLYEHGLLKESENDIELTYFEMFNGGAAWVSVLMKSGSVYSIYLDPDDFSVLGFMCLDPENAERNGYNALFDAVRNNTLEQYYADKLAEFEHGVG